MYVYRMVVFYNAYNGECVMCMMVVAPWASAGLVGLPGQGEGGRGGGRCRPGEMGEAYEKTVTGWPAARGGGAASSGRRRLLGGGGLFGRLAYEITVAGSGGSVGGGGRFRLLTGRGGSFAAGSAGAPAHLSARGGGSGWSTCVGAEVARLPPRLAQSGGARWWRAGADCEPWALAGQLVARQQCNRRS